MFKGVGMAEDYSLTSLTDEEKKEIEKLKPGFNVVPESENYTIQASTRVEISRKWAIKLLKISYWLNLVTIACFVLAFISSAFKPQPEYYASTPSGQLYGPLSKLRVK
jgi:hypothetical protein